MIHIKGTIDPTTIQEAAERQLLLANELQLSQQGVEGLIPHHRLPKNLEQDLRIASLRAGYVMTSVPELGEGLYPTLNNLPHACSMEQISCPTPQDPERSILLCSECWMQA